jgi:hypothetical protein
MILSELQSRTDEKVLCGKGTQTMSEWRQRLSDAGLLDADHEKYLKDISGTGTFLDATTGHVGSANANSRTKVFEEEAIMEVDRQYDSIPLTADCMDEDVAGALFGDFDEGNWELDDDFVMTLLGTRTTNPVVTEALIDDHTKRLMEKVNEEMALPLSERSAAAWGKKDADFSQIKPLEGGGR